MAQRIERHLGGILGLLDLVDEHQEAVEFELIAAGLRWRHLGTAALSWRDLYVLIRRWQKTPGNAVAASFQGEEVSSWGEQVFALIFDQLQAVNFNLRRGKGQHPKRLQRWWEKRKEQRFGRDPIPISQFDAWWESAGPT